MIHDHLNRATAYEPLHPLFPRAFAWLRAFDPSTPDGRHEILGSDLVAIVQRYRTDPASPKAWEDHRIYGDIQYLHAGRELCAHTDTRGLAVTRPYDALKDVEKYAPPAAPFSLIALTPGRFTVFFPGDAHQPCLVAETPSDIIKVVIKFLR